MESIDGAATSNFRLYKLAVEEAKKNGLSVILYGRDFRATGCLTKYPQYAAKSLDGGKGCNRPSESGPCVPEGTYVGAVMMNGDTFEAR